MYTLEELYKRYGRRVILYNSLSKGTYELVDRVGLNRFIISVVSDKFYSRPYEIYDAEYTWRLSNDSKSISAAEQKRLRELEIKQNNDFILEFEGFKTRGKKQKTEETRVEQGKVLQFPKKKE